MKLKTVEVDGKTYAEVQDGKPVYEGDDGKPVAFDAPGTIATISRLNGEAKGHREAKEAAEAKLKAFEGIADPAQALDALNKIKNLDDKKLVDAGQVETIKAEAIKAVEERYKPIVEKADALERELHGEKIGGAFSRSKFIAEKLAIPADMAQSRFEKHFKLEDGKVVAYDVSGNKLFSPSSPGNLAGFDEAIELLVEAYPYRDHILKGSGAAGSGAQGGSHVSGGKTISRKEFEALGPADRAARVKDGVKVVDA